MSKVEVVWIQNLKGYVNGLFPADRRWKNLFIENLDRVNDAELGAELRDEKNPKAIEAYDAVMDDIGTCGYSCCIVKRPVEQHAKGGCRCYSDRIRAQRVMLAARRLRAALSEEKAE